MKDKGTILVVEDTPADLELLVDTFTADGYQVLPAENGERALAAVAARPPDLVLLDIQMPGLDGFEVCRRLKALPESRDIPVVFITVNGERAERVAGLKLGAVDYITKPFEREELLARVGTHLELGRLRVRLEQQAADLRLANEHLQSELAERKELELEMQRQAAFPRLNPNPVLELSATGEINYLNGAAGKMAHALGLEGPAQMLPPNTAAIVRECLAIGKPKLGVETQTGARVFSWSFFPVQLNNTVHCYAGDITERKQAEVELQFRNILLSTQQEASIDGILVVDEEARILLYNRRFIEIWGLPAKLVEDRVDEPVLEFVTAQIADSQSFVQRVQYLYEHRQETSRDELILADSRVIDRYSAPMFGPDGRYYGRVWYFRDITVRKQTEAERDRLIQELQKALANVKSLSGLLPICAGCKKIRDDKGYWSQVESYVQNHSEATFTHGLCPDCIKKYYPELEDTGLGGSSKRTP